MTQISGNNFPSGPDGSRDTLGGAVAPADGDSLPGFTPTGGDDLNVPFVPDEEPKDREPAPETEGPLDPQHDHEKTSDA